MPGTQLSESIFGDYTRIGIEQVADIEEVAPFPLLMVLQGVDLHGNQMVQPKQWDGVVTAPKGVGRA